MKDEDKILDLQKRTSYYSANYVNVKPSADKLLLAIQLYLAELAGNNGYNAWKTSYDSQVTAIETEFDADLQAAKNKRDNAINAIPQFSYGTILVLNQKMNRSRFNFLKVVKDEAWRRYLAGEPEMVYVETPTFLPVAKTTADYPLAQSAFEAEAIYHEGNMPQYIFAIPVPQGTKSFLVENTILASYWKDFVETGILNDDNLIFAKWGNAPYDAYTHLFLNGNFLQDMINTSDTLNGRYQPIYLFKGVTYTINHTSTGLFFEWIEGGFATTQGSFEIIICLWKDVRTL